MADTTGSEEPDRRDDDREQTPAPGPPPPPGSGTPAAPREERPVAEPGWSAEQPPPWTGRPRWTAPGAEPGPADQPGTGGEPPPPTARPEPGGWRQPTTGAGQPPEPAWDGQRGWGYQPWQPDVKPGIIPLRPLGVGEILDGAISAMRRHPKIMLGVAAVVGVVASLLNAVVTWFSLRDIQTIDTETATNEELFNAMVSSLGATLASFVVVMLVTVVATGILTAAIGRAVLGQPVTLDGAWRAARPFLFRLIGLSLLSSLAVVGVFFAGPLVGILIAAAGASGFGIAVAVLGGIGGAIAAVFLYVKLALASPALILERQRIVAAMRRSYRLVTGGWWRTLGVLILAFVLAWIISGIIQTPFSLVTMGTSFYLPGEDISAPSVADVAIQAIGGIIASTITLPFTAGVTTLLYVDRRMRREGLDIELARTASAQASQPRQGR